LLYLWESKSDKEISDRYCVVALSDGGSYQSVNPSHMGRIVHCVGGKLSQQTLGGPCSLNFIRRAAVAVTEHRQSRSCAPFYLVG